MTPDEILQVLKKEFDITITRQTLTNYENQGLLSIPQRGSAGRGIGRWTKYPDQAFAEAYAAYSLLNGNYESIFTSELEDISGISTKHIAHAKKQYHEEEPFTYNTTLDTVRKSKEFYERFVFETWKYHYEYALKAGNSE